MPDTATINMPSATSFDEVLCNKTSEGVNDVVRVPVADLVTMLAPLIVPDGSARFSLKSDLEAASVSVVIQSIAVLGYSTIGDCSPIILKRIATPDPVEAWHWQSNDGAYWEITNATPEPEMFGAAGKGLPTTPPQTIWRARWQARGELFDIRAPI